MKYRYTSSRSGRQAAALGLHRALGRYGRFMGMALLVLVASQGTITPCSADLVIQAENATTLPGDSGSFDIVLMNTAGGSTADVAADYLDISISGPAAITITDVTMSTAATYIFAQSFDADYGLSLVTSMTPTSFESNDSGDVANGYPGYQVVNPGETYGLAHVDFTVSASAPLGSSDTISIDSINIGTSLSDNNYNLLPFTPVSGTVFTGSIPEPSALIQGATAALIGLGALGWRRRSAGS